MANYPIEDVEGIGPVLGKKLREAGVSYTDELLAGSRTRKLREELAARAGISEKQILKFANMVDLYRVKGIGSEFSELLEAAGVDTVPELAQRNAANLAKALEVANAQKGLTRRVPAEAEVAKWIEHAKTLPRVLEY